MMDSKVMGQYGIMIRRIKTGRRIMKQMISTKKANTGFGGLGGIL